MSGSRFKSGKTDTTTTAMTVAIGRAGTGGIADTTHSNVTAGCGIARTTDLEGAGTTTIGIGTVGIIGTAATGGPFTIIGE